MLETGSVSEAARAAGMNRRSAQRLRQRLAGTPFDRTWDRALAGYAAGLANPFAAADAPAPPSGRAEAASPARK